jgi:hypothetical protein
MATRGTRIHLREDEEYWEVDQIANPHNAAYGTTNQAEFRRWEAMMHVNVPYADTATVNDTEVSIGGWY